MSGFLRVLRRYGTTVLGLALLGGAIWVVQEKFGNLRVRDIEAAMAGFSTRSILLAGFWTVVSYWVLTFYDALAARYVGAKVAYWRSAFASFCAYTFAHNLGVPALSGAATRYRLYSQWGLSPIQIAGVVAFCTLTFGLGAMTLGGLVLFTEAAELPVLRELPTWLVYALGGVSWAVVAAYVIASKLYRAPIRAFGGELRLPGVRMATTQVVLASIDVAATALIFYALLPERPDFNFWHFLGVYLFAYSAGLAAHLPGGIGVFDTAIAVGLSPWFDSATIFAAIVVFRLYYYLLPMGIAGVLFAAWEIRLRGNEVRRLAASVDSLVVPVLAGFTALVGAILIFQGARGGPGENHTLLLELSKFAASTVGCALLVVAWGLLRRVTLAWAAVIGLLTLGIGISIAKGLAWWVPSLMILALLLLLPFRLSFYRATRLWAEPLSASTLVPAAALVLCTFIVALFTHGRALEMGIAWWEVPFTSETPWTLAATMVLSVALLLAALWRLLHPARLPVLPYTAETRRRVAALAGAKAPAEADGVVFGEGGDAAVVYRRLDGVLLALGDPIGAASDRISAIWRFRDMAEQKGLDPAAWRIGRELRRVWQDIGLTVFPMGADGRPLPDAPDQTIGAQAFLACRAEHDLTALLPALPQVEAERREAA